MNVSKPKSTQYGRLRQYADSRGIHYRNVEIMCGLPYRSVSHLVFENINRRCVKAISVVFPNLNTMWLMYGTGDMLIEGASDEIGYFETPRIRLTAFIRHLGINIHQFEVNCKLPIGYISRLGTNITNGKLNSIGRVYKELNLGWVDTGEGTMLNDGTNPTKEELMNICPKAYAKLNEDGITTSYNKTEPSNKGLKGQNEYLEIERNFYKAEVERLTKELADARTTILALTDTIKKLNEK